MSSKAFKKRNDNIISSKYAPPLDHALCFISVKTSFCLSLWITCTNIHITVLNTDTSRHWNFVQSRVFFRLKIKILLSVIFLSYSLTSSRSSRTINRFGILERISLCRGVLATPKVSTIGLPNECYLTSYRQNKVNRWLPISLSAAKTEMVVFKSDPEEPGDRVQECWTAAFFLSCHVLITGHILGAVIGVL